MTRKTRHKKSNNKYHQGQKPRQWIMCTKQESKERENLNEISIFEATSQTWNLPPNRRIADPCLCIKKYRRSAAGGGVSAATASGAAEMGKQRIRSLSNLESTVCHLLQQIFSQQISCKFMSSKPQSLSNAVNFVNDRIRSVQVDFVHHLNEVSFSKGTAAKKLTIRNIQSRIIRYHILVGYVMSEVPSSKFLQKFNDTGLQTAFAHFFDTFQSCDEQYSLSDIQLLDEMMCYASLLHISKFLLSKVTNAGDTGAGLLGRSDNSIGISHVLSYRSLYFQGKRCVSSEQVQNGTVSATFPKWKWSLQIASAADSDNYVHVFNLLEEGPPSSSSSVESFSSKCSKNNEFKILAKCCLSPSLSAVRVGLLRRWNKSFAKAEDVSGSDLARLLHMSSAEAAVTFCEEIVGLPATSNHEAVSFKVVPVSVNELSAVRDDNFVLNLSTNRNAEGRLDEDCVFVPCSRFIWDLIK